MSSSLQPVSHSSLQSWLFRQPKRCAILGTSEGGGDSHARSRGAVEESDEFGGGRLVCAEALLERTTGVLLGGGGAGFNLYGVAKGWSGAWEPPL